MQVYFTVNVGRRFRTQAGVHLIEGVRLIWGPLNRGSTVFVSKDDLRTVS